ncbi:type IV pilus secretin PilQ family protein [Ectothiorhodospiraceae bacterium WFHF3C12]|nr:type IV pilus secretin PilQ family protein [Ectothiorhodospiraceae bacterium WFHF3C12]
MLLLMQTPSALGQTANTLQRVDFSSLPGNKVQITFEFSESVAEPSLFKTENPARVALDFMDTRSGLDSRQIDIGVGVVEGVSTVEAGSRTRAVVRLSRLVPFDTRTEGNTLVLTVEPGAAQISAAGRTADSNDISGQVESTRAPAAATGQQIQNVDFARSEKGAGQVIVELSDPTTPVNVEQEGGRIVAYFLNARVPEKLQRRLDVTDFATPVNYVSTRQQGDRVSVEITPHDDEYEQIAYQAGSTFTVEVQPVTPEEQARAAREEPQYTGERLSLNFQDIEVRSVLQLIADFTDLNIVVSDSVDGNITLRLQNVPWDQALDIILKTKGLDKRRTGNVIRIAPAQEIAEQERIELESQQQQRELAPLRTDFVQVNYAKATDIASLIQSEGTALISERGSVTVDQRTNTLIVKDTEQNISDIRSLISTLDIPVRQVLIESRVVVANDDFSRELGVQFGYSRNGAVGDMVYGVGGTQPGDTDYGGTTGFEVPAGSGNEGLVVDLPTSASGSSLGLAVGRIGSYLLQLELSAMETESRGDIISSPRVITANQTAASIEQGVEIPYEEASSSGATSVSFKKAVLGLTVTPQITPDDRILLDLEVSKDSRGQETQAGPAINTQSVTTRVLVDNGETVVLGGVYERTRTDTIDRVPFFGELPFVGWMFRNKSKIDDNSELLIFVTPKILKESLALN